jgi:hypothetical protein
MSELTKALVAFHQNVGTIHKTAKSYTNQYAPLDEVLSVVTPALSKQGLTFTHTFEPGAEGSEPILICTLLHTSGETLESRLPLVVAKGKNATQDLGSAITYLKRYTLLAMLGLVADVDTDGNPDAPPEPAAKPKVAKTDGKKTVERKGKDLPTLAKAAEKSVEPVDKPIDSDTKAMVMALLKERHSQNATQIEQLSKAFKEKFPDTAKSPLSQAFQTEAHVDFINSFLDNAPA